jgi:tetratricopeptide (TPR) repeat protein
MNGAHPVGYWRACTTRLGRVILVSAFVAPCLAAAGGLEDAVSLYREARYAEALDVLNGLDTGAEAQPAGAADPQRVAEYRALCLIALDRDTEARSVMEKLLEGQPDYRPTAGEFPPRFVAAVKAVRTEMLPALVRAEYRRGKTSYDQKEYSQAEAHLRRVLTLLKDSDLTPSGRESGPGSTNLAPMCSDDDLEAQRALSLQIVVGGGESVSGRLC